MENLPGSLEDSACPCTRKLTLYRWSSQPKESADGIATPTVLAAVADREAPDGRQSEGERLRASLRFQRRMSPVHTGPCQRPCAPRIRSQRMSTESLTEA